MPNYSLTIEEGIEINKGDKAKMHQASRVRTPSRNFFFLNTEIMLLSIHVRKNEGVALHHIDIQSIINIPLS